MAGRVTVSRVRCHTRCDLLNAFDQFQRAQCLERLNRFVERRVSVFWLQVMLPVAGGYPVSCVRKRKRWGVTTDLVRHVPANMVAVAMRRHKYVNIARLNAQRRKIV